VLLIELMNSQTTFLEVFYGCIYYRSVYRIVDLFGGVNLPQTMGNLLQPGGLIYYLYRRRGRSVRAVDKGNKPLLNNIFGGNTT
jgi:hypothetical protein